MQFSLHTRVNRANVIKQLRRKSQRVPKPRVQYSSIRQYISGYSVGDPGCPRPMWAIVYAGLAYSSVVNFVVQVVQVYFCEWVYSLFVRWVYTIAFDKWMYTIWLYNTVLEHGVYCLAECTLLSHSCSVFGTFYICSGKLWYNLFLSVHQWMYISSVLFVQDKITFLHSFLTL